MVVDGVSEGLFEWPLLLGRPGILDLEGFPGIYFVSRYCRWSSFGCHTVWSERTQVGLQVGLMRHKIYNIQI